MTKFICFCGCRELVHHIFLLVNGDLDILICKNCGLMFVKAFYNYELMMESNKEDGNNK